MPTILRLRHVGLFSLLSSVLVGTVGCHAPGGDEHDAEFQSDNPGGGGGAGDGDDFGNTGPASTSGGDEGGEGDDDSGDDDGGGQVLQEADIIKVEGDLLYALSRYSGLAVLDMSEPDAPRILGRFRTQAMPFEMYVDNGRVFAMLSDYGTYEYDEAVGDYTWHTATHLLALDATDPANITKVGDFEMPGSIQDSRRKGDVLYIVTAEDGACWRCDVQPRTVVTSLNVADVAAVAKIDELAFVAPDGYGWQKSVSSTTERMYVAGPQWSETEAEGSAIDVVDISDVNGDLEAGARITVAGQIQSRWQMDEFEGVLRVVSQPWNWQADIAPTIETFSVASAHEITPLGSLRMTLPRPESLRSVRFDGLRGYAITAEQTDPLFTLDLSDPANPIQAGELEIPGWVFHMEPMGDRILALGFDNAREDGSINVSLFDVSDFATPRLVERVHFGGDWAQFAEDQNRIHKAFTILPNEGLVLVPFYGWDWDDESCHGDYQSGVQLIDFNSDDLTLRAVAPSRGQARRSFLHREYLVTVGDEAVQTFDIRDRDQPVQRSFVALASNVSATTIVGESLLRLSDDWWNGSQRLEVVPRSDAENPQPLAEIDIQALLPSEPPQAYECYGGFYLMELRAVADDVAYLFLQAYGETDQTMYLAVIDLADPAHPAVETIPLPSWRPWVHSFFGNLELPGESIVGSGDALVLLQYDNEIEGSKPSLALMVLDVTDPRQPSISKTLDQGWHEHQGGLSVTTDGIVYRWHARDVVEDGSRVAFYLDRYDVSDPANPRALPSINVPGAVIDYDHAGAHATTVDFAVEHDDDLSEQDCYAHPRVYGYDWDAKRCILVRHSLKAVEIEDDRARIAGTLRFDDAIGRLDVAKERIFARTGTNAYWGGWENDDGEDAPGGAWEVPERDLHVIDGLGTADLRIASTLTLDEAWSWYYGEGQTSGSRLIQATSQAVRVIDATDAERPTTTQHGTISYCYDIEVAANEAYCSLGQHGVQVVPLD